MPIFEYTDINIDNAFSSNDIIGTYDNPYAINIKKSDKFKNFSYFFKKKSKKRRK